MTVHISRFKQPLKNIVEKYDVSIYVALKSVF